MNSDSEPDFDLTAPRNGSYFDVEAAMNRISYSLGSDDDNDFSDIDVDEEYNYMVQLDSEDEKSDVFAESHFTTFVTTPRENYQRYYTDNKIYPDLQGMEEKLANFLASATLVRSFIVKVGVKLDYPPYCIGEDPISKTWQRIWNLEMLILILKQDVSRVIQSMMICEASLN